MSTQHRSRMKAKHKMTPLTLTKRKFLLCWLIPILAGFAVFRVWPLIYGFYISFFDWDILSKTHTFLGVTNYVKELTHPLFKVMLWNTSYFAFATTVLSLVVSLVIALMLNKTTRFKGFFRTLFYLPNMTSLIAVSIVWMWLYQPQYGLLNSILRQIGLPTISWLKSPDTAMISIVIMSVWRNIGFPIIVLLAGLQSIPQEYYEAAKVTGAKPSQVFFYITLPLMKPVILFVTVTSLMEGFKVFQQIYIMTGGGPLNSTTVFAYRIFQLGFAQLKFGRAASLAFILFGFVLVLTIIQLRIGRSKD